MIDWMIQVTKVFEVRPRTLFTCAQIMDNLFKKSHKPHPTNELHLSGIACLHIAIKFDNMRCHSLADFVK